MKYSNKFEKDYEWYLSVKDKFNFDGVAVHLNKYGKPIIISDPDGKDAKYCFYVYDAMGKIVPTSEPIKLQDLLRVKGSINLHIKMYAEDRAKGILPKVLFDEIVKEINAPQWFVDAVETQKFKYYSAG